MITVVAYGGNISSILNMLDYIGVEARPSSDPTEVSKAEKIILPGVGAFDKAMGEIRLSGLVEPLEEAVLGRGRPVLGVCLGMQLLGLASEEGVQPGLGWIDARSVRITAPPTSDLKVPNVGWRTVRPLGDSALFEPEEGERKFYFAHSYHLQCADPGDVAAVIDYGASLCCAVAHGTIFGVQFHPEKSHRHGMRVLEAFAKKA